MQRKKVYEIKCKMTKQIIIMSITIFILLSILATVIGEPYTKCEERLENGTNCTMITPTISCSSYTYDIFYSNGTSVVTGASLTQLGGSIYYFNFTLTEGDYIIKLCDDSTREFRVTETYDEKFQIEEDARMYIAMVVGIGLICFLLMWLSFNLEQSHGILKLLLQLVSISLILIIPSVFIIDNYANIFYRAILYLIIAFWLYVGGYFVYFILNKLNEQVKQT